MRARPLVAFAASVLTAASLAAATLPPAVVGAVAEAGDTGEIWVGTLGAGLIRATAGRIDRFTQFNSGLAGDEILSVAWWNGRVFCATGSGVSAFDPRADDWALYFERRADAPQTLIVELAVIPPSLYARSSRGDYFRYDPARDGWNAAAAPTGWAAARGGAGPFVPGRMLDGSAAYERPGGTAAAGPVAIGLLSPVARIIAVPGGGNPAEESFVDRLAVETAITRRNTAARAGDALTYQLSPPAFNFERYGWGTPEDGLPFLALRREVAGAVGRLGAGPRVETWLASRLGLPLVDASPDGPADEGPDESWVFGCNRYGHASQLAVLDRVLASHRRPRLAILRTPGAGSNARLNFWAERARARGVPVQLEVNWNPETEDPGPLVARMRTARIQAVLSWTGAPASAAFVRRMREAGLRATFAGGDEIVNDEFARLAPAKAGAILAAAPCAHSIDGKAAGPVPPGDPAFEAAAHLLTAIDAAGPDRAAVREALRRMPGHSVAVWENAAWRIDGGAGRGAAGSN